ncbi:MAG: response regulator [Agriterribacter sp.]
MIKVLVVDDDEDLLQMIGIMLRAHKMQPNCVGEAGTVRKIINNSRPDVILMDIFLGNYDGRTICSQLKSDPEFAHIPVILYSAAHLTAESVLESGADEFLHKPFSMNMLVGIIEHLAKS